MRRASRIGRHRLIRTAAVVTSAAAVSLVTGSAAQASWTPAVTMTANRWEGGAPPAVAVDRYGDTLLAWFALNQDGNGCYHQIQLRIRSRGGKLGPIETLTPCGPEMDWPVAAIDDNGDGVVAWVRNDNDAVEARRVSPTGKLGPLLTLTPKGDIATTVSVAMSSTGEALAVWVGQQNAVHARYIAANGALGPVRTLGSSPFDRLSVVIGRNGTATVAWADESNRRVVARRLTPGHVSGLQVIMPAAASTTYGVPPIADDTSGDTVFAIGRTVTSGNQQPTYLAVRLWSHGGTLGRVQQLAQKVSSSTLATDSTGDSIVAWSSYINSAQSAVFGRRVSRTGALGPVVKLGLGYLPAITVDPAGAGLVAWQSTPPDSGALTQVYARPFAAATGKFGSQFTLTPDGDYVRLAESWAGKFAAIWQQSSVAWPIRARFGP
jgi:hypothetical protein